MTLIARALDRDSVMPIVELRTHPHQEGLVASNAITLAQAQFEPGAWVRGLWVEQVPVGLVAMVDLQAPGVVLEEGDPEDGAYLWRLMIDARHQGNGCGRAAFAIAIRQAREWGRPKLYVSVSPRQGSAIGFYEKLGMRRTGREVGGEVELWMALSG